MAEEKHISELGRRLRQKLDLPLPGPTAHTRLSPEPRFGWTPGHIPDGARTGAGLLLLYPRNGAVYTVLTMRNAELQHHSSQLSLPGGAVEPGESVHEAALREAAEEIGLQPGDVDVVGELTPLYIPVSGFALHPVVAVASETPSFQPDPSEVERLIEVSVEHLKDPAHRRQEWREYRGQTYRVPYVRIGEDKLWGATAMVFAELLAINGADYRAF